PGQSLVERVSSLPLVSSTYGLVWSVYAGTKHTHPYLRTCARRPSRARAPGLGRARHRLPHPPPAGAADRRRQPPGLQGLDRIERTLPILQRPPEQIVSSAKDAVSDTLSSAVERTRAVVLGSRLVRLVSSGVDTALSTSESLVDQYLPGTEDEELDPVRQAEHPWSQPDAGLAVEVHWSQPRTGSRRRGGVWEPGTGPLPEPAAPDHLPGPGLQPAGPAGPAGPAPAGGAAGAPGRPSGADQGVPGPRHGLHGQQHTAQLAGGALLSPHGRHGNAHSRALLPALLPGAGVAPSAGRLLIRQAFRCLQKPPFYRCNEFSRWFQEPSGSPVTPERLLFFN
ncbi:unnamed protein product, partial [Tetraodon nigroviridis]